MEARGEGGGDETLLDWCVRLYPEVAAVQGRNPWEGGILHRLDYETEGLVLFARTQRAMDSFLAQQREGRFSKDYGALSAGEDPTLVPEGFPLRPESFEGFIESGFRPYGPGRKTVRPLVNPEKPYRTEILVQGAENPRGHRVFTLRIQRGFRHQIRCHLAWIGYPLVNDPLYGGKTLAAWRPLYPDAPDNPESPPQPSPNAPFLALRAQGLSFYDPETQEPREYTLPAITLPVF
jgi:23S rRNA pseudouridine1911/1915/1917 synthase